MSTPIASGREAGVFAPDDDRVLRGYRRAADVTDEAEAMAYVAGLGFPVPAGVRRARDTEPGDLTAVAARVRGGA